MIVDKRIEFALRAMRVCAKTFGLKRGVGCVLVQPTTGRPYANFLFLDTIVRAPDPAIRGEGDLGTNYFGVAMSKVAYSLSNLMDSGTSTDIKFGEVQYRGCTVLLEADGSNVFFAFSGGTEDEDAEISKAGRQAFVLLTN